MVFHRMADLRLGGTHIYDNLVGWPIGVGHDVMPGLTGHLPKAVQNIRNQFDGGAHRDGHHNDIGLFNALPVRDHPVHQADGKGRLRTHRVLLHTQDRLCKAPPLEVDGHGAANQAQADNSYRGMHIAHFQFFIHFLLGIFLRRIFVFICKLTTYTTH